MIMRKIAAMHLKYGTLPGLQCRSCAHCKRREMHGKTFIKCRLYGDTHGQGTDWRLGYAACGMHNADVDMCKWTPVSLDVKHGLTVVQKIEGQITFDDAQKLGIEPKTCP